jgi:hypothetical protein
MVDYSAMKSYMEKNNFHYFTFCPNCKKPVKAIICHLLPDTSAKDISNRLEDLRFSVINVRQMTATRRGPNGQTLMDTLLLSLVTLTRNIKAEYT